MPRWTVMNIYNITRCCEREVTCVMTRLANFPPSKVTLVCSHDATSCSFLNHVTSGVGSPHTVQVRLRDWRGVRGQGVNTWSRDLQLCLDKVIREQVRVSGHPAHGGLQEGRGHGLPAGIHHTSGWTDPLVMSLQGGL